MPERTPQKETLSPFQREIRSLYSRWNDVHHEWNINRGGIESEKEKLKDQADALFEKILIRSATELLNSGGDNKVMATIEQELFLPCNADGTSYMRNKKDVFLTKLCELIAALANEPEGKTRHVRWQ